MLKPDFGNIFFRVSRLTALWNAYKTSTRACRVGMCDKCTFCMCAVACLAHMGQGREEQIALMCVKRALFKAS